MITQSPSHEQPESAGQHLSHSPFEPYLENDPRNVVRLLIEPSDASAHFAQTESFDVSFLDRNGELLQPIVTYAVEYRAQQDVVDLVAFSRSEDGTPLMALQQCLKPPVAARSQISDLGEESGLEWNLPGAYIRHEKGEFSIDSTIDSILANKLGVERIGSTSILGGMHIPSVGSSTEAAYPRIVEVKLPTHRDRVSYGEKFLQLNRVKFFSPQEVVDLYFSGELRDIRSVLSAFAFAAREGLQLKVPLSLTKSSKAEIDTSDSILPIRSAQDLRSRLREPSELVSAVQRVEVTPSERSSSFLGVQSFMVRNVTLGGETSQAYPADVLVRKGVDSVDVAAHCFVNGKSGAELFMPVKVGVRPSMAVRERAPHPIQSSVSAFHLEGGAESLEGERTRSEIEERARSGIEEEFGIAVAGTPRYLGRGYPSAGTNAECAHLVSVEVNPSIPSTAKANIDETVDKFLVTPSDIISLWNQGVCRDGRLALSAYILQAAQADRVRPPSVEVIRNPDVDLLNEIVHHGSEARRMLSAHPESLRVLNAFDRNPLFRKMLAYSEDELGMVIDTCTHPEQRFVFDGLIPHFFLPELSDPRKPGFHLGHDIRHYVLKGMGTFQEESPGKLLRIDGKLVPLDFEDYYLGNSGNECDAVNFSDVLLPSVLGYEECQEIFGALPIGKALEMLGVDGGMARKVIFQVEQEGRLPSFIVNHPAYDEVRSVLVGRLLRYNTLDRHHLKMMYESGVNQPEVFEVLYRTRPVFCDAAAHIKNFEETIRKMEDYPEGGNPLRARLARTKLTQIDEQAMTLRVYGRQIRETAKPGAQEALRYIDTLVEDLIDSSQTLAEAHRSIGDIDLSEANLRAVRTLRGIEGGVALRAREACDQFSRDTNLLTPAAIAWNRNRPLPFLRPLPFGISRELKDQINRTERRSFILEGKTPPAPFYDLDKD